MQLFHLADHEALQAHLDEPGPAASLVTGATGAGKSTLVRRATGSRPTLWLQGSDLPAPLQAREHLDRLRAIPSGAGGEAEGARDGWEAFGKSLVDLLLQTQPPREITVVWDRADPLLRDRRWREMIASVWTAVRAHARPLHMVFIARDPAFVDALPFLATPESRFVHRHLRPLGLREATAGFDAWSPVDRLVGFCLLGGEPRVWDVMEPGVRLRTNLARLLLEPGGDLRTLVEHRFPIPGRNPGRALALVHALAHGAEEWGELRDRSRVFRTSSELGPYVKGLREAGLVAAHRSLDAGPESRNRRYRLVPPLLEFWYRLVRPHLPDLDGGAAPSTLWGERMRSGVPELVSRRLPALVVDHLRRHGMEQVRAPAREAGALWGDGYDIPVAGTLTSGAAFYASTSWDDPGTGALDGLAAQVRKTRYGYGRQIRLLLLFVVRDVSHELERRVARGSTSLLLRPADLFARG